tara:strand:- start:133 stop:360 length:228 start_codon:yes stop_codon:yes gene_type:complete
MFVDFIIACVGPSHYPCWVIQCFFWQNVLSATDYLSMGCMTDGLSWFGNSFLKNVAPAARQLAGLGFLNEAFFDQ